MNNPADVANHEIDIRAAFDIPANWDVLVFGWRVFVSSSALECGDYGGAGSVGMANIKWAKQYGAHYFVSMSNVHSWRNICGARNAGVNVVSEMAFSNYRSTGTGLDWVTDYAARQHAAAHPVIITQGGYSSEKAWFALDVEELREELEALDGYPVISDDMLSEVESEWEWEAVTDYGRSDLERAARDIFTEHAAARFPDELADELADELTDELSDIFAALPADEFFEIYRQAAEDENAYPETEYMSAYIDSDRLGPVMGRLFLQQLEAKAAAESGQQSLPLDKAAQ